MGIGAVVLRIRTAALLLVIVVAGCGESSVPEGSPVGVRIETFFNPIYGVPNLTWPQPLAVYPGDPNWERVSRLLPDPLPQPVDGGSDCEVGESGRAISVRMSSGGDVDYGPCGWPEQIVPVRLLMTTLLQRAVAVERRCGCRPGPSPSERGWAVLQLDAGDQDDELAVVHAVRVYRSEEGARAEAERLGNEDASLDYHYFYKPTVVERDG